MLLPPQPKAVTDYCVVLGVWCGEMTMSCNMIAGVRGARGADLSPFVIIRLPAARRVGFAGAPTVIQLPGREIDKRAINSEFVFRTDILAKLCLRNKRRPFFPGSFDPS
jgi:hypothetical protein